MPEIPKEAESQTQSRTDAIYARLEILLQKLPPNKVLEWLSFGDFLLWRSRSSTQKPKLGDRFAGVWLDDRTAEEIIADIRDSRVNSVDRETL